MMVQLERQCYWLKNVNGIHKNSQNNVKHIKDCFKSSMKESS